MASDFKDRNCITSSYVIRQARSSINWEITANNSIAFIYCCTPTIDVGVIAERLTVLYDYTFGTERLDRYELTLSELPTVLYNAHVREGILPVSITTRQWAPITCNARNEKVVIKHVRGTRLQHYCPTQS